MLWGSSAILPAQGAPGTEAQQPQAQQPQAQQPQAQQPQATPPQRAGRRGRWRRVSEADKKKPCLIPWQRSLQDALALVQKTGKPLLICVNMDGEPASESIAWGRYRDPAFAKLASGFIPVLASPNRHSPRDHDDHGRRLVDPRFGRLIDAEHIRIEPEVYARWFQERRVAPRHLAVSPEGKILFDLFLLRDLSIIDKTLAEFGKPGALVDPMTLDENHLLASPDAACRDRLERLYRDGDPALRRRLAGLSLSTRRPVQHPEILRMALRDRDPSVRGRAVETLALHPGSAPLDIFGDAFFAADENVAMQENLIEALRAWAVSHKAPKVKASAQLMATKRSSLLNKSRLLDLDAWTLTLAAATPVPDPPLSVDEVPELSEALGKLDQELDKHPEDAFLQLRSAELNWRFARVRMAQTKNPMFLLEDQKAASLRALATGDEIGGEPRAHAQALLALAYHYLDEGRDALLWSRRALPALRSQAADPLVRQVLEVFLARARGTLQAHMGDAAALSAQSYMVPDLLAAGQLRLRMPAVREQDYVQAAALLQQLGAQQGELAVLRKGLLAFPRSGQLHASMRVRMLACRGARALRDWYSSYDIPGIDARWAHWFAGLGLHHAAERFLANRQPAEAKATWEQSFGRFRASFLPASDQQERPFFDSSAPFRSHAWAGLSRIALAENDLVEATRTLLRAFQTWPKGYQAKDALGQSPLDIALRLLPLVQAAGLENQSSDLRAALDEAGWKAPEPRRGRRR